MHAFCSDRKNRAEYERSSYRSQANSTCQTCLDTLPRFLLLIQQFLAVGERSRKRAFVVRECCYLRPPLFLFCEGPFTVFLNFALERRGRRGQIRSLTNQQSFDQDVIDAVDLSPTL